jgi:hypothetical protein
MTCSARGRPAQRLTDSGDGCHAAMGSGNYSRPEMRNTHGARGVERFAVQERTCQGVYFSQATDSLARGTQLQPARVLQPLVWQPLYDDANGAVKPELLALDLPCGYSGLRNRFNRSNGI